MITVSELKKLLSEYPDDSEVDIFLTTPEYKGKGRNRKVYLGEPNVTGSIDSVDFLVESDEGVTYLHITGDVQSIEWPRNEY